MRPILLCAALAAASPALAWDISTDDIEPICTWSDARWEQSATLLLPGTDTSFADVWQGRDVRLTGTLGTDLWYRLRFRVALRGPGIEIGGDIDPAEDQVFSLDRDTLPMGPIATLVGGARFTITGPADDGGVIVGPDKYAADDVWSPTAWAVLPCEDMTVHWRSVPETDEMLEAIGFPLDAPTKVIPKRRSARLYAGSDGPLQGIVQPAKYARHVAVAQTLDGRSHIALADWTGTVWHGWIPEKRLRDPEEGGGGGLLGGIGGQEGEEYTVRRCEMDTPLRVYARGWSQEVGTVKAGTPFQVQDSTQGWWEITFPAGWIAPHKKSALLVAADSSRCPQGTWTHPPIEGIEGLLSPDDLEGLDDLEDPLAVPVDAP